MQFCNCSPDVLQVIGQFTGADRDFWTVVVGCVPHTGARGRHRYPCRAHGVCLRAPHSHAKQATREARGTLPLHCPVQVIQLATACGYVSFLGPSCPAPGEESNALSEAASCAALASARAGGTPPIRGR